MSKHNMRKLHIDGEIYEYSIGKDFVIVRNSHNIRTTVNLSELTGQSWDDIEKGQWDRYFHITPSIIRDYIIKNRLLFLLGR